MSFAVSGQWKKETNETIHAVAMRMPDDALVAFSPMLQVLLDRVICAQHSLFSKCRAFFFTKNKTRNVFLSLFSKLLWLLGDRWVNHCGLRCWEDTVVKRNVNETLLVGYSSHCGSAGKSIFFFFFPRGRLRRYTLPRSGHYLSSA